MQIARWGNSLAVRIPSSLARAFSISEGDEVEIVAGENGTIVLRPSRAKAEALAEIDRLARPVAADWKLSFEEERLRELGHL